MADSNSFSIFAAPAFGSYFKIFNALLTRSPRTRSATKRILRGDVGTSLRLTVTLPVRAASLRASRFSLFSTDRFVFFATASSMVTWIYCLSVHGTHASGQTLPTCAQPYFRLHTPG